MLEAEHVGTAHLSETPTIRPTVEISNPKVSAVQEDGKKDSSTHIVGFVCPKDDGDDDDDDDDEADTNETKDQPEEKEVGRSFINNEPYTFWVFDAFISLDVVNQTNNAN
jgi:hypothetical protein